MRAGQAHGPFPLTSEATLDCMYGKFQPARARCALGGQSYKHIVPTAEHGAPSHVCMGPRFDIWGMDSNLHSEFRSRVTGGAREVQRNFLTVCLSHVRVAHVRVASFAGTRVNGRASRSHRRVVRQLGYSAIFRIKKSAKLFDTRRWVHDSAYMQRSASHGERRVQNVSVAIFPRFFARGPRAQSPTRQVGRREVCLAK